MWPSTTFILHHYTTTIMNWQHILIPHPMQKYNQWVWQASLSSNQPFSKSQQRRTYGQKSLGVWGQSKSYGKVADGNWTGWVNGNIFRVTVIRAGNPQVTCGFPHKGTITRTLMFLCYQSEQTAEQSLNWPVIVHAMTAIWRRRDVLVYNTSRRSSYIDAYLSTIIKCHDFPTYYRLPVRSIQLSGCTVCQI